jgi:hypothetical protein
VSSAFVLFFVNGIFLFSKIKGNESDKKRDKNKRGMMRFLVTMFLVGRRL